MTGLLERYRFILLLCFLICCNNNTKAQQYPNSKVDQLLKSGIDDIISQDYSEAEKKFNHLKDWFPELPLGNIYLAALKISIAVDTGDPFDEEYITSKLSEAERESNKLIEKNEKDPWSQYFYALSKGYLAYYNALNKNYITAFSNGLSSITHFEKCLQSDSSFYEGYIAIGTYKYWKTEKTRFLSWVPFVKNEKELGIRLLKTAVDKSSYNRYLAANSLIWIYINENQSRMAIQEAEKALKKSPESRFFKWALARAYQDIDKKRAIGIYKELLDSYLANKNNNHYNEIVLKHKIAMLYHEIGENKNALKLCNEILEINSLSGNIMDKLDQRLARVKKLKKELQQL
ncbi:MAG: tetratricopeptide repeat protein [Bacillota bacterium]